MIPKSITEATNDQIDMVVGIEMMQRQLDRAQHSFFSGP